MKPIHTGKLYSILKIEKQFCVVLASNHNVIQARYPNKVLAMAFVEDNDQ